MSHQSRQEAFMVNRYKIRSFLKRNEATESAIEDFMIELEPVFRASEEGNYVLYSKRANSIRKFAKDVLEETAGVGEIYDLLSFSLTSPISRPGFVSPEEWARTAQATDDEAMITALFKSVGTKRFADLFRGHCMGRHNSDLRDETKRKLAALIHETLPTCPIAGVSNRLTRLAWGTIKTTAWALALATIADDKDLLAQTKSVLLLEKMAIPFAQMKDHPDIWVFLTD